MKKMFIVALLAFAIAACGGKKNKPPTRPTGGSAMGSDMGSGGGSGDTGSGGGSGDMGSGGGGSGG